MAAEVRVSIDNIVESDILESIMFALGGSRTNGRLLRDIQNT